MTLKLEIDGVWQEGREGETLLALLQRLGMAPPALCHDPRLPPAPRCRLCEVQVAGEPHPQPACALVVREGLSVRTQSADLAGYRHQWLERLAGHVEPAAMQRHPERSLHRALSAARVAPRLEEGGCGRSLDSTHPLIQVDLDQCIACQRCVRVCNEIQGQGVWHQLGRGEGIQLLSDGATGLGDSHCVSCGGCVDACPTAALTDTSGLQPHTAVRWTRTVCPYCGVGCELELGADAQDRIVGVRAALDGPVNKGHLCVKGRFGQGYVDAPSRVTTPMIRRDGAWVPCSWDEALAYAAERLMALKAAHGPQALGVLGSARATNEDNYLAQKFARLVLETHNVDCCARVCHAPTAVALKNLLGTGAATNSFDDIEHSRLFLIVGANPTENHPVIGARLKQQLLRGQAQAIVIDPRRTELAELATLHLAPWPGTDVPLFNAMAQHILASGVQDSAFAAERLEGWAPFVEAVNAWTPERAEGVCGVPAALIRAAAELYARTRPAMSIHGLGLTEQVQGVDAVMGLVHLALLCGHIGQPGSGVNPLRGQNNVQGSAHMGCEPGSLPGGQSLAQGRATCEAVWGQKLPEARGLTLMEMMDAAGQGRFKGLLVVGYDIAHSLPDSERTWAALEKLELVVVQDLVLTQTAARFGHVFLPACSAAEKSGSFMNAERRVQRVRPAVSPRGEARPDWWIQCALAQACGHPQGFEFEDAAAVWDEVRRVWPAGAGMSNARLDAAGLQWPCRDEQDPGSTLLHRSGFSIGPRATLRALEFLGSPERPDDEFPVLLITGRNLYQFNAGTMSHASAVEALRPADTLDLAPEQAEALGLAEGQAVRVCSRHGEAVLPLRVDARVAPGMAFATFHDPEREVNRLIGPWRDAVAHTPAYKRTAIRIQPA
ncbi:formate dehydrogenase subunit alpha [Inhella gelatinilytica]|uniref:Formate dehydrogenase subunit alpha n=1 Tax=Inhella gelatinilytica TaxID=2795030 RepID=A0A931IYP7_9BURK|nr:formate dehydrogenase subunit alpha [Inhella gelatinilytica]MBH9554322.1 formate dehydrogenase subunit alpha [Inhella gelatinilytica]